MQNVTSDDTFTDLWHSTIAAEQALDKSLLKIAKTKTEAKQEKSYPQHRENLRNLQLESIGSIVAIAAAI